MSITLKLMFVYLLFNCFDCLGQEPIIANEKPNILLLLTDDESWFERSSYGFTTVKSPNFDLIAERGVLFNNSHSSAPSCAPSRASLMTGKNFWELEEGAFIQGWVPSKFETFPQILKKNGYFIARTGKGWGPGIYPPNSLGPEEIGLVYKEKQHDFPGKGLNAIDYAGNVELMLNSKKPDQPFFFWVGIEEPHGPIADDNYKKLLSEYGVTPEKIFIPGTMKDNKEVRTSRTNFLYEILYSDTEFGKILKHLEMSGELDNTLIIVTSDNGTAPPVMIKGKASPYEAGTRVPFAVMMPKGVPGGRVVDDFITSADIGPTILDLAGIEIPREMTGKSFLNALKTHKSGLIDKSKTFAITGLEWHGEFDPVSRSFRTIRTNDYAYIERFANVDVDGEVLSNIQLQTPSSVELYDLKKDPWQQKNIAGNSDYTKVKKQLSNTLSLNGMKTNDPRYTGDMEIFNNTRKTVQMRKHEGYKVRAHKVLMPIN